MGRRVGRQQVWHLHIVQADERNGCRGQVAAARLGLGSEAGGPDCVALRTGTYFRIAAGLRFVFEGLRGDLNDLDRSRAPVLSTASALASAYEAALCETGLRLKTQ